MSKRVERLGSEYRKEISAVIAGRLKDKEPELSGVLVSVTEADVAPDLKTAKIYVSVYAPNPERKKRTFEILNENAGFIRRELSQVMRQRTVPALRFLEDGSLEYGSKMDEILSSLEKGEK